jgi:putative transposase
VDYINGHAGRFGVVPICRVLTEHGIPIAPSTYYDAYRREPSLSTRRDEELRFSERLTEAGITSSVGSVAIRMITRSRKPLTGCTKPS